MARPRRRLGNLPAELTSFVGRRQELADIRKRLASSRLVSLVGPGGVGKTRLAIRTATDLGRGFADGAFLVELAEVRAGALVPNAVLGALDLRDQAATRPMEILRSHLQDKRLLLVLDNCEHLIDSAAELVVEVLRAAPELKVIATSREPLQVPGEQVVPVPPLELPDGAEPLAKLKQNEAAALFQARAVAASGSFELTASNQAAVVSLCRRLDGLPLAIELAAVRTRVLTVDEILDRLDDRFELLTGRGRGALPRHQTLRTTIDWSYDLLTTGEQVLLRRLCVFAGRFTYDDVRSVCISDGASAEEVVDMMSSLVDKSLVLKEDFQGRGCYRQHETMREYADLKLAAAGEKEAIENRCFEHYRTTCLRLHDQQRHQLVEWLAWVELEIDNVRTAMHGCISRGEFARGLDIAASLAYYWVTHGTTESIRWLDRLLEPGDGSLQTLARAFGLRGWLSLVQADPSAATPRTARSVATARKAADPSLLSQSLSMAAMAEDAAGDPEAAQRFLDEAGAMTPALDDYAATIELVQARAAHAFFQADVDTAETVSLEGVHLSREAGDLFILESMLRNLGVVAMTRGDLGSAKPWFMEALEVARKIDHRVSQYLLLAALAWHADRSGNARLAAQLLGAADAAATAAGAGMVGPFAPVIAQTRESVIRAVGASKFDADFKAGKRLDRKAALRLALGESGPDETEAATETTFGPLAKREAEVAQLLAEGLSNKQIGARLFISEGTVATHVRSIMNKLGLNSRVQIANWMSSSER